MDPKELMGGSQGNARSTNAAVCTTSIGNYSIAHVLYICRYALNVQVFQIAGTYNVQGQHSLLRVKNNSTHQTFISVSTL